MSEHWTYESTIATLSAKFGNDHFKSLLNAIPITTISLSTLGIEELDYYADIAIQVGVTAHSPTIRVWACLSEDSYDITYYAIPYLSNGICKASNIDIKNPARGQVKYFAWLDPIENAGYMLLIFFFLQQGVLTEIPHDQFAFFEDLYVAFKHISTLEPQNATVYRSSGWPRRFNLAAVKSLINTSVTLNSSPSPLSSCVLGRGVDWYRVYVKIGYHIEHKSFVYARVYSEMSYWIEYHAFTQDGQRLDLQLLLDHGHHIKLIEPFVDMAESDTFDGGAIARMKALVCYLMLERGILKEVHDYDGFLSHLEDAINAHNNASKRSSGDVDSRYYRHRRYCILPATILNDDLSKGKTFTPETEKAAGTALAPSAPTLALSPISTVAISTKRPRDQNDEDIESSVKRMQASSTQTSPDNHPTNHLDIVRSYAQKLLTECDQFARERAAYETEIQTKNTLISELEDNVTSHTATIAAAQTNLDEANTKHHAEFDGHVQTIKTFQVDTKALNGRVNELLTANEHMCQERDQAEKDHEENLREETTKAEKAARAKLYEKLGQDMLSLAKEEARGMEQE